MKRALLILLLCVWGAGLAACAVHSDRWPGEGSSAATSHGLGCGSPLMTAVLVVALAFLPLRGPVTFRGALPRPQRRPYSFFQPPERSS
jgi:hypothetical protein